jgi:hypothetical protein
MSEIFEPCSWRRERQVNLVSIWSKLQYAGEHLLFNKLVKLDDVWSLKPEVWNMLSVYTNADNDKLYKCTSNLINWTESSSFLCRYGNKRLTWPASLFEWCPNSYYQEAMPFERRELFDVIMNHIYIKVSRQPLVLQSLSLLILSDRLML